MASIPDRASDEPSRSGERRRGRGIPSGMQIEEQVAAEVLRIHHESYGTGAGAVRVHLADDYVFVVLDGLELLPNEEFMVQNGKQETVVHVRSQYQLAIQASFRAAVERATGRRVVGFSSSTNVEEPRFAVETFKLG